MSATRCQPSRHGFCEPANVRKRGVPSPSPPLSTCPFHLDPCRGNGKTQECIILLSRFSQILFTLQPPVHPFTMFSLLPLHPIRQPPLCFPRDASTGEARTKNAKKSDWSFSLAERNARDARIDSYHCKLGSIFRMEMFAIPGRLIVPATLIPVVPGIGGNELFGISWEQ